ncbi:suppressor of tub2 mutation [Apophysomyces sp. BC1015]|nr:suppressor of tub2 mutation [Apophysomyces sp. BC1015]
MYYSKVMHHLWAAMEEKNNQLRHFATVYLKTVLQAHGPKEGTRMTIERNGGVDLIEKILNRGLLDAAPIVRESCRQTFWIFRQYWPLRAERAAAALDTVTQRQLEKSMPRNGEIKSLPVDRLSLSRGSPQPLKHMNRPSSSRPSLTPSFSTNTSHADIRIMPSRTLSTTSSNSAELRRSLLPRRSTSKPLISLRSNIPALLARRPKASDARKSLVPSMSVLRMLQADDVTENCKAIRKLAEQLKCSDCDVSGSSVLPPHVLPRVDLSPILMGYLSRNDLDIRLYESLMSWDSLANVLVRVLCLNHYAPTLIISSQRCTERKTDTCAKEMHIKQVYDKGLKRLKLYLKKNDPQLTKKLLEMLASSDTGDSSSVSLIKHDILAVEGNRDRLIRGLLEWIDEITCEYVGLGADDDETLLSEGAEWLKQPEDIEPAYQWFDNNQNLELCLNMILPSHTAMNENPTTQELYICLIGRLRLVNERVFETISSKHGLVIEDVLDSQRTRTSAASVYLSVDKDSPYAGPNLVDEFSQFDNSIGSIRLCDTSPEPAPHDVDILSIAENHEESTGITVDISKIILDMHEAIGMNDEAMPDPHVLNEASKLTDTSELDRQPTKREQRIPETYTPHSNLGKTKLTRLFPDDDVGCIESEDGLYNMRKRRRTTQFHGIAIPKSKSDRIELLNSLTDRIKKTEDVNYLVFQQLQKLSKETPIMRKWSEESRETAGVGIWEEPYGDKHRLRVLLEALIEFLALNDYGVCTDEQTRVGAIVLIKQLLTNQSGVFKQYELRDKDNIMSSSLTYRTADILLANKVDMFSNVSSAAEDALESLLHTISLEYGIKVIWSMLDSCICKETANMTPSLQKNKEVSLASLFSHLGRLAPKVSADIMEEFFRNGTADILLKGYNHEDVSVRKSCVQALVGIHHSLGDNYLKTYLPSLRDDQVNLLQHYIAQTAKPTIDVAPQTLPKSGVFDS